MTKSDDLYNVFENTWIDKKYSWIIEGKKYRRKSQYDGHKTRKSVFVVAIWANGDVAVCYLPRYKGDCIAAADFANRYEDNGDKPNEQE